MKNDGGGPAFPVPLTLTPIGVPQPPLAYGMSLRDYFAAQALVGLLAGNQEYDTEDEEAPGTWADQAYAFADAMLAARGA